MSEFKVRLAAAHDEARLLRSTLGNALESEGLRLDEAVALKGVRALAKDPTKGLALIVEAEGVAIGSLYVTFEWSDWHGQWYWWLQSVYVDKDWRGKGAYTALWNEVRAHAKRAGNVRAIRLYVEAHNEEALRAYRGHGMNQVPYLVFEQSLI